MIPAGEISKTIRKVRTSSPLVHNITNYVVMNYTANVLLAVGASPVMAHATEEIEEMVSLAQSLVLNIGTLDSKWTVGMEMSATIAKNLQKPVVLDPVGAGATTYRTQAAKNILGHSVSVVRGNASEVIALSGAQSNTKGVDSLDPIDTAIGAANRLSEESGAVVCVSGPIDYIVYQDRITKIHNGSSWMSHVTGMGCSSTSLVGATLAVESDAYVATVSAMALMGIAGEMAAEKSEGPGSFAVSFLDVLSHINADDIEDRLKLEVS